MVNGELNYSIINHQFIQLSIIQLFNYQLSIIRSLHKKGYLFSIKKQGSQLIKKYYFKDFSKSSFSFT